MAVKVLFRTRKSSSGLIFLCGGCRSLLKARKEDLRTKVVTLSYDGSDRYERSYVVCPVCGAEEWFTQFDRAID